MCCVEMLGDVVIKKCSWRREFYRDNAWAVCTVQSPLEKHEILPERLP